MSIQQVFSLLMVLLSVMGIIGASGLSMTMGVNFGPGAAPLFFSVVLFILSIVMFFQGRKEEKIIWSAMFKLPIRIGCVFYVLNFLMFYLMYLLGSAPAMLIFSFLTLLYLKRLPLVKNLLFSFLWVGGMYLLFEVLLEVPFETGILFL